MQVSIRTFRPNAFRTAISTPPISLLRHNLPSTAQHRPGRFFTMASEPSATEPPKYRTQILPVNPAKVKDLIKPTDKEKSSLLEDWDINWPNSFSQDFVNLCVCADALKTSSVPVAFPTETVYGLGSDARRSAAVRGIYAAKARPADNPLIVHVATLRQLHRLLEPSWPAATPPSAAALWRAIPPIYVPLIRAFWPGPLTVILPLPPGSPLAPEVTAGLRTFGARIPRNALARALLRLADVPVAAPSANASGRPSPTAAEHVLEDLAGRVEVVLDGGPCDVGLESTVVDGLCDPPVVLRPGGVSIEALRKCPGWEDVRVAYKDSALGATDVPRAPGMKYRHYSPRAKVVLHEMARERPTWAEIEISGVERIGVIRTRTWPRALGIVGMESEGEVNGVAGKESQETEEYRLSTSTEKETNGDVPFNLESLVDIRVPSAKHFGFEQGKRRVELWDIDIGPNIESIARGLFSSLRELDRKNVEIIFVEGIKDEGDVAAAVMNRLRKAAEVTVG